jgi:hypothetical protein
VLLAGTVVAFGWALVLVGELLAPGQSASSGSDVAVGWALLFVLALVSGAIYFTFLLMRVSRWTIFLVLAGVVTLQTLASLGDRFEPVAGLPWILMALLLAGWILFGVWYLRVPRIAAPDLTGGGAGARQLTTRPGGIGRRASTELLLTGKGPFRLASTLAGPVLGGILLAGFFRWLFGVDWWVERPNNTLEASLATSIGIVGALLVNTYGSRARYLWLLGSGTRAELFVLLERAALKHAILFVTLIASVLVSMHFFFNGVGLDRVIVAVLLTLGFIPLAAYAGIARCRNFGLRDIAIVASVCLVFIVMHASVVLGDWPFGAVAAGAVTLMAAAAALRAFVRRRWQSVDWLDYKVVRPPNTAFGSLSARWAARGR